MTFFMCDCGVLWYTRSINPAGQDMFMHLKKARRKGDRVYLSIAENYREGNKTRMRHIESIGYVDELQSPTCPDPIAFWQAEVDRRNAEAKAQAAPVMVKLSRLLQHNRIGSRLFAQFSGRFLLWNLMTLYAVAWRCMI